MAKKTAKLKRAPVIAVLGHVDHGKTSLLDNIFKTNIQAHESSGITQHIGARQIIYHHQPITFIDTPGHAAFAKMRQHGAQVTDLVVLVVAADDGVKPQTKESIRHIKAAKVPLIVAINKMDLPGANADLVKSQLVSSGIHVEGFGGDTVVVETVATTGKGVSQLLDMIILVVGLKGLKGAPQDKFSAVVIESKLEKQRGPVSSVIVKAGTLKIGDNIQTSTAQGKVKALFDYQSNRVKEALAGQPVEILGFKQMPLVGEVIVRSEETAVPEIILEDKLKPVKKDEKDNQEEENPAPRIKAIIKADTQGTLQAILASVAEEVEKVGQGVGSVNQSDVLLAQATGSKILCFRVKPLSSAQHLAQLEGVEINTYQAIYDLLEDLEKQVLKILEPTIDEEVLGVAKIAAAFTIKKTPVLGCKVVSGKIDAKGQVHLVRRDKIIASSTISSLKQGKKDIQIAKKGEECGITLKPQLDFKIGDNLQYYRTI